MSTGFKSSCPSAAHAEGDVVVFAPERSLLPDDLKSVYVSHDTGASYLGGSDANRVSAIKLRGEISESVVLPNAWVAGRLNVAPADTPLDTDFASALGIVKYRPMFAVILVVAIVFLALNLLRLIDKTTPSCHE